MTGLRSSENEKATKNPTPHIAQKGRHGSGGVVSLGVIVLPIIAEDRMRIALVFLGLASIAAQQQVFNFGDDEPGKPPAGFEFTKTGKGADPEWVVEKQPDGERV